MKRPKTFAIIAANLVAIIALVFIFPHLMIAPGPVVPAHAEIASNCFACHSALRGVEPERCQACHVLADIGVRTTTGAAISGHKPKVAFHQQLLETDCVACHDDHVGPKLTSHGRKPFSHELIRVDVRKNCAGCHAKPEDNLHRNVQASCDGCHESDAWEPASFNHDLLAADAKLACEGCHRKPKDDLHRQFQGNCLRCHSVKQWKPSTFDHRKFFVLDQDHDAPCATCHENGELTRYTCYGCHEHTPAKIRAEHLEEGIRNFGNCVECHRSADGEGGREGGDRGSDD